MRLIVVTQFSITLNKVSSKWEVLRTDTIESFFGDIILTETDKPNELYVYDNLDDARLDSDLFTHKYVFSKQQAIRDSTALLHFEGADGIYITKHKTQMNLNSLQEYPQYHDACKILDSIIVERAASGKKD